MTGTLWSLTGPEPCYKRPKLTGSPGPGRGGHCPFHILHSLLRVSLMGPFCPPVPVLYRASLHCTNYVQRIIMTENFTIWKMSFLQK